MLMKTAALLSLIAFIGATGAIAQGTFAFQNNSSFPIKVATGTDASSLAAATVIGAANPLLGPASVVVELFVAVNGSTANVMALGTPVGRTLNSASALPGFQGTFDGGDSFILPNPFIASKLIEYAFYGYSLNGQFGGWSALGTAYTPGDGTHLPPPAFGTGPGQIGGWILTPLMPVPEPSTVASGVLGALTLYLARRGLRSWTSLCARAQCREEGEEECFANRLL